ncbi:MAG: glycosyltransferase family 1 protein, partial [Bacteroidetes bacterium]
MSLGIPAVVSPVGVNNEIIKNGTNGFFADSSLEWNNVLSKLIEDASLRENIGKEGRKTIENFYSVNAQQEKYLKIFSELIN